ncbi:MAG: hypothetical protein HQL17_02460 [Candidatus Omnitrophica bacterium]|nr:hypothetical protein [Candidatus Omnitrophota bacterium]
MYKFVSHLIILAFVTQCIVPSHLLAQAMAQLPAPGTMVALSDAFKPSQLQGMVIDPKEPFKFDFLISRGDEALTPDQKKSVYQDLIKYFLASLAVPEQDQWVNLSPYENSRIVEESFGMTEMGRDLLAQDYMLKQITASLLYPDDQLGKKFWEEVYQKAQSEFGTTDIPVNTFNKVWIVPSEAVILEKGNTALILKTHLKVMLEQDYLSMKQDSFNKEIGTDQMSRQDLSASSKLAADVVRKVILPAIEKEVNEGRNFANLRQIVSGMIMAAWFKKALKQSVLGQVYADQRKVKGVDQDPANNQVVYQQYVEAFKKGAFNLIREDMDKYSQELIPRKYFSGGFNPEFDKAMTVVDHAEGFVVPADLDGVTALLSDKAGAVAAMPKKKTGAGLSDIELSEKRHQLDASNPKRYIHGTTLNVLGAQVMFSKQFAQDGLSPRLYAPDRMPEGVPMFRTEPGTNPKDVFLAYAVEKNGQYTPGDAGSYASAKRPIQQFPTRAGYLKYLDKQIANGLSLSRRTEMGRMWTAAVASTLDYLTKEEVIIGAITDEQYSQMRAWSGIPIYFEVLDGMISSDRLGDFLGHLNEISVKDSVSLQYDVSRVVVPVGYSEKAAGLLRQLGLHLKTADADGIEIEESSALRAADLNEKYMIEQDQSNNGRLWNFNWNQWGQEDAMKAAAHQQVKGMMMGLMAKIKNGVDLKKNLMAILRPKVYLIGDAQVYRWGWRGWSVVSVAEVIDTERGVVMATPVSRIAENNPLVASLKKIDYRVDYSVVAVRALQAAREGAPAVENNDTYGGIDLNSQHMNMQIKRDGAGMPLPLGQQDLSSIKIDGLVPVILDIRPVVSLPALQ